MHSSENTLNSPQRHQQHTRQILCDHALSNADESPRCRPLIARPHTPTPLPGSVENARANNHSTNRSSRYEELQISPRWQVANREQDENLVPTARTLAAPTVSQLFSTVPCHYVTMVFDDNRSDEITWWYLSKCTLSMQGPLGSGGIENMNVHCCKD